MKQRGITRKSKSLKRFNDPRLACTDHLCRNRPHNFQSLEATSRIQGFRRTYHKANWVGFIHSIYLSAKLNLCFPVQRFAAKPRLLDWLCLGTVSTGA